MYTKFYYHKIFIIKLIEAKASIIIINLVNCPLMKENNIFNFKNFTLIGACAKTHVPDEKSPSSRLAKLEKTQFTSVNEYFSDKHNSLSRKSGKKWVFALKLFNLVTEPNHYSNFPVLRIEGNICLVYKNQSNQKKTTNSITRRESNIISYNWDNWTAPVLLYGSYNQMYERSFVSKTTDNLIKVVHASDQQGNCFPDNPDQFCQNILISYPKIKHKHQTFFLNPIPDPIVSDKNAMAKKEERQVNTIQKYRNSALGQTYKILKGDSHRHSAYSGDRGMDNQIKDTHRFALDTASLEWLSIGDLDNIGMEIRKAAYVSNPACPTKRN